MKRGTILSMVIFCTVFPVFSEEAAADLEFWTSFGVDLKPAKGLKLYLEKQLRYEDKFTNMDSDISEVGLRYKLNKLLDLRVNYRFVSLSGEKRNRFDGNVYLNFKWNTVKISNRTRLQRESIETLEDIQSELELRNRLRILFTKNKKIKPFFGGEIFIGLGEKAENRKKFRLTAGTQLKIKKRVSLTLFYHYQRELQKDDPDMQHIFGLKFNVSL